MPLKELAEDINLNVSNFTIRRAMKDASINAHPAAVKPFVSARNAKKRVNWCKDKVDWSLNQWKKVLWTDETSLEVQGTGSKRIMVWRRPGQRFEHDCLTPSFKSGRVTVMMWGCFIGKNLGPIVLFPEGRIDSKRYCEMLDGNLLPFLRTLPKNAIFAQDNAPIHTSKYTKLWLEKNGIEAMEWPPQSPDLNPIENVWHELKVALKNRRPRVKSRDELLVAVQEEWENLGEKNSLGNLVKSMRKRCEEVIASKGMPINY
jgi:transposase